MYLCHNYVMTHESERGFICPSGCISPDACVNAGSIRALHEKRVALDTLLSNETAVKAIQVLDGSLGSIGVRAASMSKENGLLTASCGLYRDIRGGHITTATLDKDLPPID